MARLCPLLLLPLMLAACAKSAPQPVPDNRGWEAGGPTFELKGGGEGLPANRSVSDALDNIDATLHALDQRLAKEPSSP
jgi:hypothetical protein